MDAPMMRISHLMRTYSTYKCLRKYQFPPSLSLGKTFDPHKSQSALFQHLRRSAVRNESRPSTTLAEKFKQVQQASSEETETVKLLFRTTENNPLHHNLNHEGLFYTMSENDAVKIQTAFGADFNKQRKTFQETCIMVRKPALEIFEYVKNTNLNHPVPKIILYGKRGTGKSLTLAHVLHYVHNDGWVVMHTPWPAFWRNHYKEVSDSSYKPNRIDFPVESVEWLKNFYLLNSHHLNDIQTRNSYSWSKRESLEEGKPIKDLIEFGVNRMKYASDCVGAVIKEMKLSAQDRNVKVAVIIDGVNALWGTTKIRNEDRSFIPTDNLTLVHNVRKLLQSDWNGGVVICSVDAMANHYDKREDYKPVYLLGREGFELMDPFIPVCTSEYSNKEAYSCLEYYIDRMWIQNEQGRTEEGKKQLLFLSNKTPYQLMRVCRFC